MLISFFSQLEFEWCVGRCGSKKHQLDTCLKEIELYLQCWLISLHSKSQHNWQDVCIPSKNQHSCTFETKGGLFC